MKIYEPGPPNGADVRTRFELAIEVLMFAFPPKSGEQSVRSIVALLLSVMLGLVPKFLDVASKNLSSECRYCFTFLPAAFVG